MGNDFERALRCRGRCLGAFCLINFFTGALYVWSVFAGPLAERLASVSGEPVSAASLAGVFGLATGITPAMMLAGGIVNDRMGPRAILALGGAAIAAGYCLASGAESAGALYGAYGVLVGAGTGLVNGCTINTAVKFFPERRGFAGGLVTACLGIGAAALPFAANALLAAFGIGGTLRIFGIASGAAIIAAALFTARCPDGFRGTLAGSREGAAAHAEKSVNWIGMLKSPTFVPLAVLFVSSTTMGLMLLSSIASIARLQAGFAAGAAAAAVSVISLANTGGRFVSGAASDRIGRVPALSCALLLALAGFGLLAAAGPGDALLFFSGVILIGLCFGAFVGIYPGLVADEYGPKHNSVNFSVMAFGYSVGGFLGPFLLGLADTADGRFGAAYGLCAAVAGAGLAAAFAYTRIKRRGKAPQAA